MTVSCPVQSSCTAKRQRSTNAPWMINTKRIAELASFRHTLWQPPKRTGGATLSSPRRQAAPPESCHHWSMVWVKVVASFPSTRFDRACLPRRLLVTCASTMQRYLQACPVESCLGEACDHLHPDHRPVMA